MPVPDQPVVSGTPEGRRPYWPVAAGLLAFVLVLVVAGFLLNRHFRASVGVTAAPTISAPTASAPASSAVSAASPSVIASAAASSSVWPAPTGTVTPLGQEVAAAYQHYWQVYSDALLRLDTSQLSEVATGDELQRIQAEVDGIRKKNEAVRVSAEHNYFVFNVTPTQANVYDEVHDRSFTVDPVTKQPGQGPQGMNVEKDTYFLSKVDGVWKVTKSTRQRDSGS